MSENSGIEWTDNTWNPLRGCTKVSPGCDHCYAETFAERFRGTVGHPYENGFDLRLVPEHLADPFKWSKSCRVFVNSMSDMFHKDIPEEYIQEMVEIMMKCNWHIYQILTKRSAIMQRMLNGILNFANEAPHIWWGVSVEDKMHGLPRIDHLRKAPAKIRFLSIEPLLEDLGEVDLTDIHWVIVGGESGSGARPMEENWVLSLRDQCIKQKVPFFFKQWGGVNKKLTGRLLEGKTYDEEPPIICATPLEQKQRHRLKSEYDKRSCKWNDRKNLVQITK